MHHVPQKNVFADEEIYRAGGDEFLIIITDMTREDFYDHYDRLKARSRVPGEPSFAIGAHFEDEDRDIAGIMSEADRKMYADKAEYYEENPQLKRKEG